MKEYARYDMYVTMLREQNRRAEEVVRKRGVEMNPRIRAAKLR